MQSIEETVAAEIEARSEAWENLLVLADDIGVRVAGSEGEVRARDFLLRTLEGYGLDDCDEVYGDSLARTVTWNGSEDVSALAGTPVRLRFLLRDADLYSLRFK